MPEMDGIAATELLTARVPTAAVVMMSVQGEADYLRRSMLAGAREFLVKPFSSRRADRLHPPGPRPGAREDRADGRRRPAPSTAAATASRAGSSRSSVPKGGVGRTTIAVNLAVAAAAERGQPGRPRGRLVPVRRRRRPAQPQPEEQVDRRPRPRAGGRREPESLDTFVITHSSGAAGPPRAAVPGDGRAGHPGRRAAGTRGARARSTTWSSWTARRRSTSRPWPSSTSPT